MQERGCRTAVRMQMKEADGNPIQRCKFVDWAAAACHPWWEEEAGWWQDHREGWCLHWCVCFMVLHARFHFLSTIRWKVIFILLNKRWWCCVKKIPKDSKCEGPEDACLWFVYFLCVLLIRPVLISQIKEGKRRAQVYKVLLNLKYLECQTMLWKFHITNFCFIHKIFKNIWGMVR